jgi:hypothetical protein
VPGRKRSSGLRRSRERTLAEDAVAATVRDAFGAGPDHAERLRGGRNNLVWKVEVDGRTIVAKSYFTSAEDPRDRIGTEFGMLAFLRQHGVTEVPEPIACDRERGVALYEYIEGTPVRPGEVSTGEALQLGALLERMWSVRVEAEREGFRPASDAAFSLRDYVSAVRARFARMRPALADADAPAPVREYVDATAGTVDEVFALVEARASSLGHDQDRELAPGERTLNPGDIGFQNAIRRPDGRLTFVDFEYAGWDDPARVAASVCLPPEVPLPPELHVPVLAELVQGFGASTDLAVRIRLSYPLLALKWSAIVLNEFVPTDAARRSFARTEAAVAIQLEKSKRMLALGSAAAQPGSDLERLLDRP